MTVQMHGASHHLLAISEALCCCRGVQAASAVEAGGQFLDEEQEILSPDDEDVAADWDVEWVPEHELEEEEEEEVTLLCASGMSARTSCMPACSFRRMHGADPV